MIDRETILSFMKEKVYKPMTVQELEEVFAIDTADEFKNFMKLMNELEVNGEIVRTRTDRYGLPEKMNLIKGKLQGHAKGFGFVIPETPGETDVYVHANDNHSGSSFCRAPGTSVSSHLSRAVRRRYGNRHGERQSRRQ